jgi:hypothetical protein
MRSEKIILVIFFVLLLGGEICAQYRKSGSSSRHRHAAPWSRVNGPVFQSHGYPYNSFGIKLGDPFALTYKFYASEKISVAIDFGRASSSLYDRYFREKFAGYAESDTFSTNSSLRYLNHKVKSDMTGEAKVLYHVDAASVSPGLQFYIGVGWAWKNTRLRYNYIYESGSDANQKSHVGRFDRNRLTMGPQIAAGLEYAYFEIPVCAFIEVEYFTDIQGDPGWTRFEGGVGLRYIF